MKPLLKLCLLLLITIITVSCATEQATPPPLPTATPTSIPSPTATPEGYRAGWNLVWQDEFDGDVIDETKWSLEVKGDGFGNNELQYYTDQPENAFLEDGHLVIQAFKLEEKYLGREYTSAKLQTAAKADWIYGRFEIRAKMPEGQGIWPAFWMLPSQARYGGWPSGGEMDIMEYLGHEPNIVHGTIHYRSKDVSHIYNGKAYTLPEGDFANEFHTFAFEWEETAMHWYVDDVRYLTQTVWQTRNSPYPAPFDQPFYLIMNVAVGGNWPGSPDETTVFPQRMEVDYVRVYEKSN